MALKEKTSGAAVILYPSGMLMGGNETDELEKRIAAAETAGNRNLLLNLSNVSMMNSTALGVLIAAHKRYKDRGAQIRLCNVDKKINQILVITKLSLEFDVHQSEGDALAGFA